MQLTGLLLYVVAFALCALLPAAASAHPATGIVVDAQGNTYYVQQDRHANRETLILKRTPRGEVSTLAGGAYGHADGRGTRARFRAIGGLTFGPGGSLYVTDAGDLRRVGLDGEVKTLARGLEEQLPNDTQSGYGGLMGLARAGHA